MNRFKKERAERLFRAIGELDDDLIARAYAYRSQSGATARPRLSRVWMVAAALSLSFVLLVSALAVAMRSLGDNKNDAFPPQEDENAAVFALDQLLLEERDTASYTTLAAEEALPYFDGNVYLVWQYADSRELCMSRALTPSEVDQVKRSLGKGIQVGDTAPAVQCRVWVLCGNGEVLSPYLLQSAGNIGSAALFDYEAELIPSDQLINCISGILN